ncbi:hypothetical protein D3C78_1059380 [compost metagenome]
MAIGSGSCIDLFWGLNSNRPMTAAITIAPTCPQADGTRSTKQVTATMMVIRGVSGQRLRAIPHTACATTATATTFNPCSTPNGITFPSLAIPSAKRINATADGSVKPAHAANAPV